MRDPRVGGEVRRPSLSSIPVTQPRERALVRRLRYLRDWELANVLVVPAMVALIWKVGGDPANTWGRRAIGVAAVSYVLLQGGVYWYLKLAAVRARHRALPAWFPGVFETFHRTNLPAFAAIAVWMILSPAPTGSGMSSDLPWGLALVAFAALEHVNYYEHQLMHDTEQDMAYLRRYRRLRSPSLRQDLSRAAASPSSRTHSALPP